MASSEMDEPATIATPNKTMVADRRSDLLDVSVIVDPSSIRHVPIDLGYLTPA
jgi:hypothetical protein